MNLFEAISVFSGLPKAVRKKSNAAVFLLNKFFSPKHNELIIAANKVAVMKQ